MFHLRQSLKKVVGSERLYPFIAWFLWIFVGTVFYGFHDHYTAPVALYQSTSIGWAIGWSLPMETHNADSAGLAVIYIAEALTESKVKWTVEVSRKQLIEKEIEDNSLKSKVLAWLKTNDTKCKVIGMCIGCFIFGVFGGVSFDEWTILKSMDMTLSTLTCSGYLGLPETAASWKLITLSVYTNIGVPLLAISLGALISIFMESPDEKSFYSTVAAKLTPQEIEFMNSFEIDDGTGLLSLGEYIILMTVRMGGLAPSVIKKLSNYFKELDTKGDGQVPYTSLVGGRRVSRLLSLPGMAPPDLSQIVPVEMLNNSRLLNARGSHLSNRSRQSSVASSVEGDTIAPLPDPIPPPGATAGGREAVMANRRASIMARRASISQGRRNSRAIVPLSPLQFPVQTGPPKQSAKTLQGLVEEGRTSLAEGHESEESSSSSNSSSSSSGNSSDLSSCSSVDIVKLINHAKSKLKVQSKPEEEKCDTSMVRPFDRKWLELKSSSSDESELDSASRKKKTFKKKKEARQSESSRSLDVSELGKTQSETSVGTAKESAPQAAECVPASPLSGDKESLARPGRLTTCSPEGRPTLRDIKRAESLRRKQSSMGSGKGDQFRREASLKKTQSFRTSARIRSKDMSEKIKKAGEILEKKKSTVQEENTFRRMTLYIYYVLHDHYVQTIVIWALWLFLGAVFYSLKMGISFYKGYYYSVNVGYSVFWTSFEMDGIEKFFTVAHLVTGQILMSFAMAAFARHLIASKDVWYVEMMKENELENAAQRGAKQRAIAAIMYFVWKYRAFVLFAGYLSFGVLWSVANIKWSILQGFYFSITALSTGGIWSIPDDSPDSFFFVVAVYTCTGAPIMLLSFGSLAHTIANMGQQETLKNQIQAPITQDEVMMMYELGVEDGDGFIDRCEYIILQIIRLKAMRIDLIDVIADRFCDLDTDGDGLISYGDIQGENDTSIIRQKSDESIENRHEARWSGDVY